MPIGEFASKSQVRDQASTLGLVTAAKKDSQGICFVGKVGIKDFLSQYVSTEPGPIIDQAGQEIGKHEGAIFYTIGQRHGLNVGGGFPYYVIGKNMDTNEVFVTTDLNDKNLWSKSLTVTDAHWINSPPQASQAYQVRTRYRAPLVNCTVRSNDDGTWGVHLDDEVRAITPGQSAVLYEGSRVVGGGIVI